jgi:hypothetical protein
VSRLGNWGRLVGAVALVSLATRTALAGGPDDLVTAYFRGEGAPNNVGGPLSGTITFSSIEGQISSNPAVAVRVQSTTATGWPYVITPWKDLRMEVGRTYYLTTSDAHPAGQNNMQPASMHPSFIAPPGYYIDTFGKLNNNWSTGSYPFRVMPYDAGTTQRAGSPESFTSGSLKWGASLGKDHYGASAGSIRLIDVGFSNDWSSTATRAGLKAVTSTSVASANTYWDANGLRQIKAPETFVDVVTISDTTTAKEYEIRFYDAATVTLTGSAFPYSASGTPFVVYDVLWSSGTATGLQITSKTYGTSGYPSTPARSAVSSISRSGGTWPGYTWTVNDWTTNATSQQLVRNVETWTQAPGGSDYIYARASQTKNVVTSEIAAEGTIKIGYQSWG